MGKTIEIDEDLYDHLMDRDTLLTALEALGVKEWEKYDDAVKYSK